MEWTLRRCQRVVTPLLCLAGHDQTGLPQVRKMAGYSWLRQPQNAHDVADAHFALVKNVEDAQTSPVGEGPEHEIDTVHRCCGLHILPCEYNRSAPMQQEDNRESNSRPGETRNRTTSYPRIKPMAAVAMSASMAPESGRSSSWLSGPTLLLVAQFRKSYLCHIGNLSYNTA